MTTTDLKRLQRDVHTLKKKVATLERRNKKHSGRNGKKAPALRGATPDPLARFIGAFDSKGSDWAEQHDRYLGENLAKELRGNTTDA